MLTLLTRPWRAAFTFNGRATRREYWLFVLQVFAIGLPLYWLFDRVKPFEGGVLELLVGILLAFVGLFLFIAAIAAGVRRLHDQDKKGVYILWTLIPIVGGVLHFFMMIAPGTAGANRFGSDPRMPGWTSPEDIMKRFD